MLLIAVLLSACDNSGSSGGNVTTFSIEGGGVKGPLANADVNVYTYDASQAGFKGLVAATATTNDSSAITGLALPFPLTPPYIIEFTSNAGTTDVTTGMPPVIGTLRSAITQALLDKGEQIYATPLTTMAVDIAISKSTAATTAAEFEVLLAGAAKQVVSSLGFGLPDSVDIFDTPPLIDDTTTTDASQSEVAAYRSAIEAVSAIAFEMEKQSTGDVQTVLSELSMDLADGVIDGTVDGNPSEVFGGTTLDVLAQTPATLVIPNTNPPQTVSQVQEILVSEKATTGSTTATEAIDIGGSVNTTTIPAEINADTDGDGTLNIDDAFPLNANESVDTDNDGIGDNADLDDDNNGILDTDEGNTPVVTATDTDGDGILDAAQDNCVANYNPSQVDTDNDGEGNACDTDDDGDGTLDTADLFPTDSSEQSDADKDGTGDNADTDDDNDSRLDTAEDLAGNSADHDGDGIPNREDIDSDNDGVLDTVDASPYDAEVNFNFAPTSISTSISTNEDTAVAIVLTATDEIDDTASVALTYTVIDSPLNGSITGTAPNLSYTPAANFNGNDIISFTATDSTGKVSNTATVSITVISVNDIPLAIEDSVSTDEDVTVTTVNVLLNDTDADGDTLSIVSGDSAATKGSVLNNNDGTFTYTPNANSNGSDSFTYTLSDGNGGEASATVLVTITPVNDLPTISGVPATTIANGVAYSFTPTAADVDGEALTFAILNTPAWATFNEADGQLSGTPPLSAAGNTFSNITISVNSGSDTVALPAFAITVDDVQTGTEEAVWDNFNWDDGSTWK
jgi:hypothetical protein